MGKSKNITEQILKRSFEFYDIVYFQYPLKKNKNGEITLEELKRVFGTFCTEMQLLQMLKEVDINGDGKITYEEFKIIMSKFRSEAPKLKSMWTSIY